MIFDARKWVAAKASMINGKGTEKMSYYKNCSLQYLEIHNIHSIRDSYKYLIHEGLSKNRVWTATPRGFWPLWSSPSGSTTCRRS